jgi:hypothetical protein
MGSLFPASCQRNQAQHHRLSTLYAMEGRGGSPNSRLAAGAKLIATAIVNEGSFAELLDRRLKRIEEMKLIEAKSTAPTNGGDKDTAPIL